MVARACVCVAVVIVGIGGGEAVAGSARVASVFEPGAIARGDFAVRGGVSIANGPFGIGGQLVLGLGGAEVFAGVSGIPGICLGDGCAPATVFASGGAQVAVLSGFEGRFRLGMRAALDADVRGVDEFYLAHSAATVTVGPVLRTRRYDVNLIGEAIAAKSHEAGFEAEHDGYYVGGSGGAELRGGNVALVVLAGAAAPLSGQEKPLIIVTIGFSIHVADRN
jgi:hypothetical protein